MPPSEPPLDPLLDPELLELLELPELLALPPLEPEPLDVMPELLPLGIPLPLLLVLATVPPLLPLPLLLLVGWTLFIVGAGALEVPLVSNGVVPPPLSGGVDVQRKNETATSVAVPRLSEWRFFISPS